jgi:hypothetical protein
VGGVFVSVPWPTRPVIRRARPRKDAVFTPRSTSPVCAATAWPMAAAKPSVLSSGKMSGSSRPPTTGAAQLPRQRQFMCPSRDVPKPSCWPTHICPQAGREGSLDTPARQRRCTQRRSRSPGGTCASTCLMW